MLRTNTITITSAIAMRAPVKISSMVAASGYDSANQVLRIEYGGGGTYDYYGVPQELAEGLHNSESPGRYMKNNIKGQFESRAWQPQPQQQQPTPDSDERAAA